MVVNSTVEGQAVSRMVWVADSTGVARPMHTRGWGLLMDDESQGGAAAPSSRAPAPLVLSVEDDPDTLDLLGQIFTDEGYRVHLCLDEGSARQVLGNFDVNLLVVDARLRGSDGTALLQWLENRGGRLPAVIMLTGMPDAVAAAHGPLLTRLGALLEPKPFDVDHLLEVANRLTGWPGPA